MRLLLPLAAFLLASCIVAPHSAYAVTPQRPTLSSDTATTASGTAEHEAGVAWDPSDSLRTPLLFKYGFDERTEFFAGGDALVHLELPGEDETGIGDLVLGARHRFREETDHSPSTAFQGMLKIPTADEDDGLGTGELDGSFAAIATKNVEHVTATGYYSLDILGNPSGGQDVGHSFALAAARSLHERIGTFAELAFVWRPESDFEELFTTIGMTLQPRPSAVLDAGFVIGITDEAPDFQLVVGITRNAGDVRSRFHRED